MKAPSPAVKPGFIVCVDNLAWSESGASMPAYLDLDRYGELGAEGSDGFVTDIELASKPERLPVVNAWLEKHPTLALHARIIHYPTMVVVRP